MIHFFKKLTAVLVLALFLGVTSAFASGKMEINMGQRVDLEAQSKLLSPVYKWTVKKGNDILDTQTARGFSFIFPSQGEYAVNLMVTGENNAVEGTTIYVLAGDRYPRPAATPGKKEGESRGTVAPEGGGGTAPVKPLILSLSTLPPLNAENQITLVGDGKVQFFLGDSSGDILEYRIDRNIYEDSDGNSIANDDIDNSGHDSYLTGKPWSTVYKKGEAPKIAAQITLVDKDGQKVKKQAEILFTEDHRTTGDPVARLEVLPLSDVKDGLVHLYEDPHKVSFYARPSEGKILEYRIDRNIFEDSNGDGDPKNDIDNLNDFSFKTGDVFEIAYAKTDEQIIAQLIVVGEGGKGSRVQKGFVFGEKPAPLIFTPEAAPKGIRLTADKDYVNKGDPITFTVEGLTLSMDQYTFQWDLNGDGETDKEIQGENRIQNIYETAGVYQVKVIIQDQKENSAERTLETVVKEITLTKADFIFETEGNTVRFKSQSTASFHLADKTLQHLWSFGDTEAEQYEKQKDQIGLENPSYTYVKAGKYLATLTVTDADLIADSKSAEIQIEQDLPLPVTETAAAAETAAPEEEAAEGASLIMKILKVILYLVLIVVGLIFLIVGGFLIFLKIQHSDLTFEELIGEFKLKILTMLGAEEGAHPKESSAPFRPTETENVPVITLEEETAAAKSEEESAEKDSTSEPSASASGPMPPWLKDKEVIEGEVEEKPVPQGEETLAETPSEETAIPETSEDQAITEPAETLSGEFVETPEDTVSGEPDWLNLNEEKAPEEEKTEEAENRTAEETEVPHVPEEETPSPEETFSTADTGEEEPVPFPEESENAVPEEESPTDEETIPEEVPPAEEPDSDSAQQEESLDSPVPETSAPETSAPPLSAVQPPRPTTPPPSPQRPKPRTPSPRKYEGRKPFFPGSQPQSPGQPPFKKKKRWNKRKPKSDRPGPGGNSSSSPARPAAPPTTPPIPSRPPQG